MMLVITHIIGDMCEGSQGMNPQNHPSPQMQIRDGMKLRAWQPTPVFLPEESHGERSLADYNSWGPTESGTSEVTEHVCIN